MTDTNGNPLFLLERNLRPGKQSAWITITRLIYLEAVSLLAKGLMVVPSPPQPVLLEPMLQVQQRGAQTVKPDLWGAGPTLPLAGSVTASNSLSSLGPLAWKMGIFPCFTHSVHL